MKISFRRIFWIALFLTLLILVAIATRYVFRNFIGIGPVPTRSAFEGRLPGTPEGDYRRYKFYYTTNRINNEETFNGYGHQLGDTLLYGTYDALISPYMPVLPFMWFDTTSMEWAGRRELAREPFKAEIKKAVQESPHKSILVIVWGFRDWFRSAALKTAYTAFTLDINTPVLLFDWPGNQGEGRAGYAASQIVASQSAPDLGQVLAELYRETGAEKIWLMGSSLGCQTICEAFAWLSTQPDLIEGKPKLSHVILSAPDVAADAFNEKFSERIQKLSEHLTAYVSSNDRALLMSHWVNRERRLGRLAQVLVPPENRTEQYEFEEAMELLDLQAKGARNISIVDATPINRLRNLHHFFTDSPEFFDDLYQRLLQPDDFESRRLYPVKDNRQGSQYWILWDN